MERSKKTNFILRQLKKKNKKMIEKNYFNEFFYINKERNIIEFLKINKKLVLETFFKKILPLEFRDFIEIKILNDVEEEINTWYYNNENILILILINWGIEKQEISIEIDIENFIISLVNTNNNNLFKNLKNIDSELLNEFILNFLTIQAKNLSKIYSKFIKMK